MEITATVSSINTGITRNATDPSEQEETRPNAFGIGEANRAEAELSPQARILQQTDANQRELSERLEQQRQAARERADQERESEQSQRAKGTGAEKPGNVASSDTQPQRRTQLNNVNAEKAAEIYQSISKLV